MMSLFILNIANLRAKCEQIKSKEVPKKVNDTATAPLVFTPVGPARVEIESSSGTTNAE